MRDFIKVLISHWAFYCLVIFSPSTVEFVFSLLDAKESSYYYPAIILFGIIDFCFYFILIAHIRNVYSLEPKVSAGKLFIETLFFSIKSLLLIIPMYLTLFAVLYYSGAVSDLNELNYSNLKTSLITYPFITISGYWGCIAYAIVYITGSSTSLRYSLKVAFYKIRVFLPVLILNAITNGLIFLSNFKFNGYFNRPLEAGIGLVISIAWSALGLAVLVLTAKIILENKEETMLDKLVNWNRS